MNELVCVSPEKKVIPNSQSYSDEAWILNCVTRIKSGEKYNEGFGNVFFLNEKCSNIHEWISYSSLESCKVEATTSSAFLEVGITWIPLAVVIAVTLVVLLSFVSIGCYRRKKNSENHQRQESVNNPMYGMSEDYGYYMESRIEETNPDYDAYYKEDSTNITDDNEIYGNEEK